MIVRFIPPLPSPPLPSPPLPWCSHLDTLRLVRIQHFLFPFSSPIIFFSLLLSSSCSFYYLSIHSFFCFFLISFAEHPQIAYIQAAGISWICRTSSTYSWVLWFILSTKIVPLKVSFSFRIFFGSSSTYLLSSPLKSIFNLFSFANLLI